MLNLSQTAAAELKTILDRMPEPHPRLRVFIDHRCHCGNVHFSMSLDDRVFEADDVFTVEGIPFVADAETLPELPLVEIDYERDWMRQGFTIRNANRNCGGHG